MKYEMEEWGSSVTEKLDGTAPLHIGAQPCPLPPNEENWTNDTLATYKSLEQLKLQLAQTIDGKTHSTTNILFWKCLIRIVADAWKDKNMSDLVKYRK